MADKFTEQDKTTFKEMSDISAVLTARSKEIADNIGKQGENMGAVVAASVLEAKNNTLTVEKLKSRVALIQEIAKGDMTLTEIAGKKRNIEDEITAISRRYWGSNKAIGEEKIKQLRFNEQILESEENRLNAVDRSGKLMTGMDSLTNGMVGKAKDFGEALKDPITGAFAVLALVMGLMGAIASQTDMVGEKFGAIGVTGFRNNLIGATAEATKLGYGFEEVAGSVNALSNDFGIAFGDAIKISEASMDTARALGISTEQAAGLTGQLMAISGHSASTAQNFLKQTAALAKSAGVAPAAIMSDIAGSSEEVAGFTKDGGENIAQAAVKARSMGLSLGDVASAAENLLDFSSSIEKEMEASVLIGRQLNLQKARELSLAGDLAGLQTEILKQVGSEAEFNEMNVIQRKAMADAIGVSVSGMSKMVTEAGKTTAELSKMRELDISEIASQEAISNITQLMNVFKSLGVSILQGIAFVTSFGGLLNDAGPGWQMFGAAIGIIGISLASVYLFGKLAGIGMSVFAKSLGPASKGLAQLGTVGSIGLPVLGAIALVGLTIVGILYMIPPIIDSLASGFKLVGEVITNSILLLAAPTVIAGIIGLAAGFYMLAGALAAIAIAGLAAAPALAIIGGVAAVTGVAVGIGGMMGAGSGNSEELELLKEIKTGINKLVKGFGGDPGNDGKYIDDFANKVPKSTKLIEGLI